MAALDTTKLAHGVNGNVTGIGADSTYEMQFKVSSWNMAWRRAEQVVSGYGDGGFEAYCAGALNGTVTISGFVLTEGSGPLGDFLNGDPAVIGTSGLVTISLVVDTGLSYDGKLIVLQAQIDHRYNRCVPIAVAGRTSGVFTETGWT